MDWEVWLQNSWSARVIMLCCMREVQSGLAPGDEVVIFHNFYRHTQALARRDCYLEDNDLVDVNWRKWARRE